MGAGPDGHSSADHPPQLRLAPRLTLQMRWSSIMSSHKFKVGDSVTIRNEPFNLYEVTQQLPGSGDQPGYCIGIGLSKSRERAFRESEIAKLDKILNQLLDAAGVRRNDTTRSDLLIALCYARNAMASEHAVPAHLLKDLARSIENTSLLLKKALKYNTSIGQQMHKDGGGVVAAIPMSGLGKHVLSPAIPAGDIFVVIKIQKLLEDWHSCIKSGPRSKRQRPKDQNKTNIVFFAKEFFCRHSERKPSNDSRNPFSDFACKFYKVVTGTEPDTSLAWQIRQVLQRS
jgi:hypothetical protein